MAIYQLDEHIPHIDNSAWIAESADVMGAVSLAAQTSVWFNAVIRGDTYHFEVVSNESARGVGEVQLHGGVPIANAILTTDSDEQAEVRMSVKGAEAAMVAIEMANLLKAIK